MLLLFLACLNAFNSILLTPILLSLFGSNHNVQMKKDVYNDKEHETTTINGSKIIKTPTNRSNGHRIKCNVRQSTKKSHNRLHRNKKNKRCYVRVQSEISLSTISEESQSRLQSPELNIEISAINV